MVIQVPLTVYSALDKSHLAKTAILNDYETHPSLRSLRLARRQSFNNLLEVPGKLREQARVG